MKTPKTEDQLIICATLWSMVGHPNTDKEWPLARKLEAIHKAGFDGVAEMSRPELTPHLKRLGLKICGRVFTRDGRDARRLLEAEVAGGARYINVMLGEHDTSPEKAAQMIVRIVKEARQLGASAHIETHRDTCTETPEKIAEIAARYERKTSEPLPLTWDHSHLCVSKHVLPADYSQRLLAHPELIQASHMFHCRPFNSQHCQIPVTDGRGSLTPEFCDYLAFVEDLFLLWRQGPKPRGELWVCPEMGTTVGYNVSTNPPVWPDTIRCREELLGAWNRAGRRKRRTSAKTRSRNRNA